MAKKEKLGVINGLEVWVVNDPSMVKWQGAAFAYGLKTPGATSWADLSGYVFASHDEAKAKAEQAAKGFSNWKKMGAGKMNIGKLVRAKMKEMQVDLSGDYVDNVGRHFSLAGKEGAYTCSYSNGAKSMDLDHPTASKLAGASRKLGTKELAAVNPSDWIKRIDDLKAYALKQEEKPVINQMIDKIMGIAPSLALGRDFGAKVDPAITKIGDAAKAAVEEIKRTKKLAAEDGKKRLAGARVVHKETWEGEVIEVIVADDKFYYRVPSVSSTIWPTKPSSASGAQKITDAVKAGKDMIDDTKGLAAAGGDKERKSLAIHDERQGDNFANMWTAKVFESGNSWVWTIYYNGQIFKQSRKDTQAEAQAKADAALALAKSGRASQITIR